MVALSGGVFQTAAISGMLALVFAAAGCFLAPPRLDAEQIDHHGVLAESEGSAKDCIACHDPSLAGSASYCTAKCGLVTSHSIDVDYPPANNRELYASSEEVTAKGIRLISGKVSCISCHNLKNPERFHLAADSRQLCIICHVGYYK